jgi:hypothetical protein
LCGPRSLPRHVPRQRLSSRLHYDPSVASHPCNRPSIVLYSIHLHAKNACLVSIPTIPPSDTLLASPIRRTCPPPCRSPSGILPCVENLLRSAYVRPSPQASSMAHWQCAPLEKSDPRTGVSTRRVWSFLRTRGSSGQEFGRNKMFAQPKSEFRLGFHPRLVRARVSSQPEFRPSDTRVSSEIGVSSHIRGSFKREDRSKIEWG